MSRRKVVKYDDTFKSDRYDKTAGHGTHVCGTVAGRKSTDGSSSKEGTNRADGVARVLRREGAPAFARRGCSFLARTCVSGWKKNKQKGKALTAHVSRFPAFGLQTHRHRPPTQEKIATAVEKGRHACPRSLA